MTLVLAMLIVTMGHAADMHENDPLSESESDDPRHRIDISAIFLDSVSSDSVNGSLGYTYNLTSNSNFTALLPYLDPDLSQGGNSGFGDLFLAYSIVPSTRISANPWVPRTVGSGLAVLLPTGNAKNGASLDAYILSPYLGVVLPLSDKFFFAPQLGYIHSLDSTVSGADLRVLTADVGIGYVGLNGFWASYFPQFLRDLKSNDWAINHRLAVGKMFTPLFGVGVDYSFIERYSFGSTLPIEAGFDQQIELTINLTF